MTSRDGADAGEPLLEVGRTGRAHGVRGELYVDLITDRVERVAVGARLQIAGTWHTIEASRPAGTRWLVRFAGIADREAASRLAALPLLATPVKSSSSNPELWVHELIGSRVEDTAGHPCGTCTAVVANPAHDLLELDGGGLVPVVFVVRAGNGVIVIDPPEGLLEPSAGWRDHRSE